MKPLNINDIAKAAGVGKSTVSRVLQGQNHVSPDARARIESTIRELGYQPNMVASGLRKRRIQTIGLIIPDISNPFFPEITLGVQQVADERGYAVLLANSGWSNDREEDLVALAQRQRLDGMIINPVHISLAALRAFGHAVVVIGTRAAYREFDAVGSNTAESVQLALAHLHALGHTHILALPGPRGQDSTRNREAAIDTAMQTQPDKLPQIHYCEFTKSGGYDAVAALLSLTPRPTAVLCGNDLIAIGMLAGLRERGIAVPGQISVVGIDDIELASVCCPTLTTVHKPKREMGMTAANMLIDRIEGNIQSPPQMKKISTHLVIRESTAAVGMSSA